MAYPLPKARKTPRVREGLPIAQRMNTVLDKVGDAVKQHQVRLWQNWDMVMGDTLKFLAYPLGVRNNILLVGAEDNVCLQELSFMTDELLERVNAFMDAPVFTRVELHLLMGKQPLNRPPAIQPAYRKRLVLQPPADLGRFLESMDPASPVARCYAAYMQLFDRVE